MSFCEPLEQRRLMSAGIVTQAIVTADQQAITDARSALTANLTADKQATATDKSVMQLNIQDAQLTLETDKSVFQQTFADDHAALLLKLDADRSLVQVDARLAHSSPALRSQLTTDRHQLAIDRHQALKARKVAHAQAVTTLSHDRSAIIAARNAGQSALRTDAATLTKHKAAAKQVIITLMKRFKLDQLALGASQR